LSPKGFIQTRHLTFDERKKLHEERKAKREAERDKVQSKDGRQNCPFCRRDKPHTHAPRPIQETPFVQSPEEETDIEFEQAIHDSVAATSRGNAEEDIMIERAIRASVRELQSSFRSDVSDPEALNRAIQASIAEAGRGRSENAIHPIQMTDEEAEHQALLEKALQESLAIYQFNHPESSKAAGYVDTDDDENVKLAIQESRNKAMSNLSDSDEDVKLAIQNSKDELSRTKTEEEIVLEYVKKQSLAEEEHRKARDTTRKETGGKEEEEAASAADEEAMRLAIEESLKGVGGASASGS
jgi:DNA-directed RNA polymerase subunit L